MIITIRDYTKSTAPAFDAVEDIRQYLGENRWNAIYFPMMEIRNPAAFRLGCLIMGIAGFAIEAWYDHYHGQNSYERALRQLAEDCQQEPNQ